MPGINRVAVLWHPGAVGERTEKDARKEAEVAAQALGLRPEFVAARGPVDIDRAFSDMSRARVGALTVLTSTMLFGERRRLVDLAAKNRLPTVYPWRDWRRAEVFGLEWRHLDLERGVVSLEADRSKTDEGREAFLPPGLLAERRAHRAKVGVPGSATWCVAASRRGWP